jgi:gluconate 2-dehydrogenase gamma chain
MELSNLPGPDALLRRRNILKIFTSIPAGAMLAGQSAPAAPDSSTGAASQQPKVLVPHEWETVSVLCDLVIPADDQSGSATAAGVPAFIDDWLDLERGALLDEIRGGLTWLDLESNRRFGADFIACTDTQKKTLLDRIAYPAKAAPEDHHAVVFFNHFRDLVLSGFYTSEAGLRDLPYLGNEPRQDWTGCPKPILTKLGVAED